MEHVEVRVRERIDTRWSGWLDSLEIAHTEGASLVQQASLEARRWVVTARSP
jgi:hypothetical protein